MAGGAKRGSPGGVPKKNASWRVGAMRLASKSGNSLGSHGPQANTYAPARIVPPLVVPTAGSEPVPGGAAAASRRNATPWRTASATTASTARRALSAPPSGSQRPPAAKNRAPGARATRHYSLDGAAGHQRAALRLEDAPCAWGELHLGISRFQLRRAEHFKMRAAFGQRPARVCGVGIAFGRSPKDAGLVKQRLASLLAELLPEDQRTHGRAGVDLIGTVAHANDARFAARAGPRVGRAVSVGEHYLEADLTKTMSRPCAKHTSADHGYVVGHAFMDILIEPGGCGRQQQRSEEH